MSEMNKKGSNFQKNSSAKLKKPVPKSKQRVSMKKRKRPSSSEGSSEEGVTHERKLPRRSPRNLSRYHNRRETCICGCGRSTTKYSSWGCGGWRD